MKWLIASDLHGSASCVRLLTEAYAREGADRLLLLGDILYHGPRNDLPLDYDPRQVVDLLSPLKDQIFCVRGNCDAEVDQMVLPFPMMADFALLEVGGLTLYATHGHLWSEEAPPPMAAGTVLLNGHFHVPACVDHGAFLYVNPGSTSIPKAGSAPGYLVLEDRTFTWKDMEGSAYKTHTVA